MDILIELAEKGNKEQVVCTKGTVSEPNNHTALYEMFSQLH
jgi:hypothetical protein